MKIVFDVEKTDSKTGKRYFPGIEYEMSEEKAKSILNQTKYAHTVENVEKPVEEIAKNVETVETVEEVFEGVMSEITGEKPKKKKKSNKND